VSAGNIAETLGGKLAPALGRASVRVSKFVDGMNDGTGAGGRFARRMKAAFDTVRDAVQSALRTAGKWIDRHRGDINDAKKTAQDFARAMQRVWNDVVVPLVRRAVRQMLPLIKSIATVLSGVVKTISAIINGDWSKAWGGAKQVVRGLASGIKTILSNRRRTSSTSARRSAPRS
jgi:ABC-type transporter Mla subunit MlaD